MTTGDSHNGAGHHHARPSTATACWPAGDTPPPSSRPRGRRDRRRCSRVDARDLNARRSARPRMKPRCPRRQPGPPDDNETGHPTPPQRRLETTAQPHWRPEATETPAFARAFGSTNVSERNEREPTGNRQHLVLAPDPCFVASKPIALPDACSSPKSRDQIFSFSPAWPTYRRSAAAASANEQASGSDERARGSPPRARGRAVQVTMTCGRLSAMRSGVKRGCLESRASPRV